MWFVITFLYVIMPVLSSVVRAFARGVMARPHGGPIKLLLFEPVLHDWCNKGCGMCYPVCGMMYIK